ncbi:Pex19 protein family-domain-containing protein [Lineolata rhizophorae]|uniref:Pex19 protein family-domain-containing protein n=1 Tax=Lineolata rhizophorae TaxID=578093 RepID=A0A6A6PDI7_9PEZI|nr:Pex19 protein family-domain-containing protein [Lineolata rhizophorae]
MAEQKKPEQPVESAPDPDSDDLDELDDVLDQFADKPGAHAPDAPASASTSKPADTTSQTASGSREASPAPASQRPSATSQTEADDVDDDDLEKQLQAGMAELLGGLDSPEMQKQFEEMMKGFAAADAASGGMASMSAKEAAAGGGAKDSGGPSAASVADESFQETIRRTMERMKVSEDNASSAAQADSTSGDDFLAKMLREMEKGGLDPSSAGMGGPAGSDEDFSKMLLGMMEQLTNKDILYEPMKELHDKFPIWMAENRDKGKVSDEDWKRYEEQEMLVTEIVGRFERDGYKDENPEDREYILERMHKMQAAGSPPPDLVGDMNAAQEALGELDAGCPTQ